MAEKVNDPKCVANGVIIKPPNYEKENFESTYRSTLSKFKSRFKHQTNLTPEQVYWALDMEKRKAEEINSKIPVLKIVPPTTVYPPNTPSHIVPRNLPTKCKTIIGMYVFHQLFADFEKTCKKRITPTGITEGERGFEPTKSCYLTEVIPFFNLLKDHFESLEKSLDSEVNEMKAIFKDMEKVAEQNNIELKKYEIEKKNVLILNDNLIANCIAQNVFYTATDSALTVFHFHDLSNALHAAHNRVVELEGENLKLLNQIQKDDHANMIKHLSKLEVDNLNLQLKYQHLVEKVKTSSSKTSSDAPEFDAVFELSKRDEIIQAHTTMIKLLRAQIA